MMSRCRLPRPRPPVTSYAKWNFPVQRDRLACASYEGASESVSRRNWPAKCMVVPAPWGRSRSKKDMSNWIEFGGSSPRQSGDAYLENSQANPGVRRWNSTLRIVCALLLALAAPAMQARDLDGRYAGQNPE